MTKTETNKTPRRKIAVDDLVVTDEEPPPVQRGRSNATEWDKIIAKVAETPGKWGKVPDVSHSTASNLRKRKGVPPIEVRMTDVDSDTGRGTLWVRVVSAAK